MQFDKNGKLICITQANVNDDNEDFKNLERFYDNGKQMTDRSNGQVEAKKFSIDINTKPLITTDKSTETERKSSRRSIHHDLSSGDGRKSGNLSITASNRQTSAVSLQPEIKTVKEEPKVAENGDVSVATVKFNGSSEISGETRSSKVEEDPVESSVIVKTEPKSDGAVESSSSNDVFVSCVSCTSNEFDVKKENAATSTSVKDETTSVQRSSLSSTITDTKGSKNSSSSYKSAISNIKVASNKSSTKSKSQASSKPKSSNVSSPLSHIQLEPEEKKVVHSKGSQFNQINKTDQGQQVRMDSDHLVSANPSATTDSCDCTIEIEIEDDQLYDIELIRENSSISPNVTSISSISSLSKSNDTIAKRSSSKISGGSRRSNKKFFLQGNNKKPKMNHCTCNVGVSATKVEKRTRGTSVDNNTQPVEIPVYEEYIDFNDLCSCSDHRSSLNIIMLQTSCDSL